MAKAASKSEVSVEDRPVLDMNDTKVKKFMKDAKAKGFVTVEELNKILPADEMSSDRIEDTMAMLSEEGISVVDNEEEGENAAKGTALTKAGTTATVAKKGNARGSDRTDDPVRM
ncbi:MAG: RNA polymerase sigma factor region1.1 domain-containing protein, partial [Pseudomonadota bacterium]